MHQRLERVGDLHGQLAGRHHHEGTRAARGRLPAVGEAGQRRQAEREGLAGAGLPATEHVLAGQGVRDGRGLDREGRGDAVTGQAGDEGLGQAHRGEAVVLGHRDGTVDLLASGLDPGVRLEALGLGVDELLAGARSKRSVRSKRRGPRSPTSRRGPRLSNSRRGPRSPNSLRCGRSSRLNSRRGARSSRLNERAGRSSRLNSRRGAWSSRSWERAGRSSRLNERAGRSSRLNSRRGRGRRGRGNGGDGRRG